MKWSLPESLKTFGGTATISVLSQMIDPSVRFLSIRLPAVVKLPAWPVSKGNLFYSSSKTLISFGAVAVAQVVERRTPQAIFKACVSSKLIYSSVLLSEHTTHRFNSGHLQHSVSHITRSDCMSAFWNEPAAPSMMFWHARIHKQQMECLQLCR